MVKYVLKFGGTSLKDAESIKRAYKIISDFYQKEKPEQLAVFFSAPGKIGEGKLENKFTKLLENIFERKDINSNKTEIFSRMDEVCDKLEINPPTNLYSELKRAISLNEEDDASYSRIVSIGERMIVNSSSDFFSRELRKLKIPFKSFDFNEFGMVVEGYKNANPTGDTKTEIEKKLKGIEGIILAPGFLGYNENGEIATLGTDGSNVSATTTAGAINADGVYIFSDEPGVRRANPKLVPDAEIIQELSYDEAIEFAELGAKIINAKAVYPAKSENIPIYIVDENYNGTKISSSVNLENMGAKIIASSPNHYILTVKYPNDRVGVLREIAKYLENSNINIESIADERHALSIAFTRKDSENIDSLVESIGEKYKLNLENNFSRISIIGEGMRNQIGVLEKIASVYNKKGISFDMISQCVNQLDITTYIKQEHERIAVKGLYEEFFGKKWIFWIKILILVLYRLLCGFFYRYITFNNSLNIRKVYILSLIHLIMIKGDNKYSKLAESLEGMFTIETLSERLKINKTKAIYVIYRLRKINFVKTIYGAKKKRIYYISLRNKQKGISYTDLINKFSPIKLVDSAPHYVHGETPSYEEVLVYAMKKNSVRYIIASLVLFRKIKDWNLLYRLAKKENLVTQVVALYEVSKKVVRKVKRIPKRFLNYAENQKSKNFVYIIKPISSKDFKNIEKKWKVYIPLNLADLEDYKKWLI